MKSFFIAFGILSFSSNAFTILPILPASFQLLRKHAPLLIANVLITQQLQSPAFSAELPIIPMVSVQSSAIAPITPSYDDNRLVKKAFEDFNLKRLDESEQEFTVSIEKWKELKRPRDEIASLVKARASVRVDNKKFDDATRDYDDAIDMMKIDGEREDGTARYPEYVDCFVGW